MWHLVMYYIHVGLKLELQTAVCYCERHDRDHWDSE